MDQESARKYPVRNLFIGGLVLLCIAVIIWFRLSANQDNARNEIKQELKTVGFAASATIVKEVSFSAAINYRGTVEAVNTVALIAETDGKVIYSAIDKGRSIKKGEVLVKVDQTTRLSSSEISSDNYEKAKNDFAKLKELQASGNASGMEVENARLQMQNAESQLRISRNQLGQTLVYAPESGTIIDKKVNVGEYVTPGSPLGSIACLDQVLVSIYVLENDVISLKQGMTVKVSADAYPNLTYNGIITAIIPVASAAKTFPVEVRIVNNKMQKLLAGMNVSVTFDQEKKSKALVIPRSALTGDKNQQVVYLIRHSREPVRRPIITGKEYDTYLTVSRGLKAGDTVMTSGLLNVEPGKKIQWLSITK